MIVWMILWTFSKGYQCIFIISQKGPSDVIMPFAFWAIFMRFFWRAYQVEKERKRLRNKSGKMKKEIEAENRRLAKPFLNGGKLEEIDKEEREGS